MGRATEEPAVTPLTSDLTGQAPESGMLKSVTNARSAAT
jgi:hypothetical protein